MRSLLHLSLGSPVVVAGVMMCSLPLGLESCASHSESGNGTGASASLPDSCSTDESPFVQADCLDALRLACNGHETESDCTSTPLAVFGSGYGIQCLWAKVVTFSDVAACTVESVEGRCEATLADVCSGLGSLASDVTAIPSESEIVQVCGGPLGSWAAIGSMEHYTFACEPHAIPPPPPLCDCADVAAQAP